MSLVTAKLHSASVADFQRKVLLAGFSAVPINLDKWSSTVPGKEVLCGNSLNACEKIYVHTHVMQMFVLHSCHNIKLQYDVFVFEKFI